jgi:hypothetical protein
VLPHGQNTIRQLLSLTLSAWQPAMQAPFCTRPPLASSGEMAQARNDGDGDGDGRPQSSLRPLLGRGEAGPG